MTDLGDFDKAAEELQRWANVLVSTVRAVIPEARDVLAGSDPQPMGAPSKESAAGLILRGIRKRVEDVMAAHDALQLVIQMSPRYKIFFDLLELSEEGRREVWQVVKGEKKEP